VCKLTNHVFHCLTGLHYREPKILFLGLDNAGKTTLLHMMKSGRMQVYEPSLHQDVTDKLIVGNMKFKAYHDLGGHETARQVWQDYSTTEADHGVVYLVDANGRARFPEDKRRARLPPGNSRTCRRSLSRRRKKRWNAIRCQRG
jgi:GTP-binding protein SAR1